MSMHALGAMHVIMDVYACVRDNACGVGVHVATDVHVCMCVACMCFGLTFHSFKVENSFLYNIF